MKKAKQSKKKMDEMLPHYDFSKGIKGKYAKKYREGISVTIYSPNKKAVEAQQKAGETFIMIERDIANVFPNAVSVNSALRHLIAAMPKKSARKAA